MAQGRLALALFLSVVLLTAFYSAAIGFSDAVGFVRGDKTRLPAIPGKFGAAAQLVPAGTSFGFYAPQVCSEFRLTMRIGNTATREVHDVTTNLGAENAMLVSSLSTMSQDKETAKAVATSFASYGFTRYPGSDAAEVRLEAEIIPRLAYAKTEKRQWLLLSTHYFKR